VGLVPRCGRPTGDDRHRGGVDNGDLVGVHEVDEDFAVTVCGGELRLPAEMERRIRRAWEGEARFDRHHDLVIAAEGQDMMAGRIVDDAIGILGGGDRTEGGMGLQVEDR
jgi:hypothetical protein